MTEFGTLRVGVIGLGTIGRIHATRIADLGADVVGADPDPDARDAFAADFDAPAYTGHDALLEAGVDAVVVGVPNRFHEDVALAALEAGVDVLLEKPIAHDLESAERIVDAARDAPGFCAVGFSLRFAAQTKHVVDLRETGRLGSISHVDVNYLRRGGLPGGGRGWFTDSRLAGGGVLVDLGVHVIDLALHVLGYPDVVEVMGTVRSEFGDYEVDDSATALLRCTDGTTVGVETSWHGTCAPSRECVVRGTERGVRFAMDDPDLTVVDAAADAAPETRAVEGDDMYRVEDRAFLERVAGERGDLDGTLEQGLVVQRVIDAIYESSARGEAVRLGR